MADASMTRRFPRVALFDLDGTLLDSAPDMLATANRMLAARDRAPTTLAMLRQHVSKGARAMVAATFPELDEAGRYVPGEVAHAHIAPAPGTSIDPKSLEVTGIKIGHPLRGEVDERTGLDAIFVPIRAAVKKYGCQRAILVGHNAHFDLNFLNAAVNRVQHKRNPFHPFSVFDTVTMAGLAYGQTVLARAAMAAGIGWDPSEAHSAVYDTEQTARLFCIIANGWPRLPPA